MNLSSLKPAQGSLKRRKRVARGQGSGHGGTATRGMNGAGSRSGTSMKKGFEGGQMPIQRRVPKYGFRNFNRIEYAPINLATIQLLADEFKLNSFDLEVFQQHGLVSKRDKVKILGKGELKGAVTVKAHAFSKSAMEAIQTKGGAAELVK